jgi:hypothetical protein
MSEIKEKIIQQQESDAHGKWWNSLDQRKRDQYWPHVLDCNRCFKDGFRAALSQQAVPEHVPLSPTPDVAQEIYVRATNLAMKSSQVADRNNEYYVTLPQLERICKAAGLAGRVSPTPEK